MACEEPCGYFGFAVGNFACAGMRKLAPFLLVPIFRADGSDVRIEVLTHNFAKVLISH